MRNLVAAAMLVLFVATVSIAADGKFTINTIPAGATLTHKDYPAVPPIGPTPTTLTYKPDKERPKECFTTATITVQWVSGATATIDPALICPGKKQEITISRPTDFPGVDIDVNYSIELQKLAATKIKKPQDGAAFKILQALGQASSDANRQTREQIEEQQRRRVDCTSTVVENTIYTNCR